MSEPLEPESEHPEKRAQEHAAEGDASASPPPPDAAGAGPAAGDASPASPETPETPETSETSEAPEPADPEASPQLVRRSRLVYVCVVRYGLMGRSESFLSSFSDGLDPGKKCVARTRRGTELGEIVKSAVRVRDATFRDRPGEVLRLATPTDLARARRIEKEDEPREKKFCAAKAAEMSLPMRLSAVEHLLGGERLIFYFRADGRVDFRGLVRELAREYHTRIEMRQIGVRYEARLLADYEHCGQPLCCKRFMHDIQPVMMRMAKVQKTTLDPTKISGRCGRLMCCLRFEDEVYRELRKGLPGRGTRVSVGGVEAEVVSSEILTQIVHLRTADGRALRVPVSEIERAGRPSRPRPQPAEAPAPDAQAGSAAAATAAPPPPEPGDEAKESPAARRPTATHAPVPPGRERSRRGGRRRRRRGGRGSGAPRGNGNAP